MKLFVAALLTLCLFFAAPGASAGTVSVPPPSENQLLPEEAAVPFDLDDVRAAEIRVYKSERRMDLLDAKGNPLRSYQVSLGKNPVGHKARAGDGRTPEGKYFIDARNDKSNFFLSLRLSYPSRSDRTRAKKDGVSPGGDIFIHGLPNGKSWMFWKYNKKRDWTNGCIAVDNDEIKEIWNLVADGTPIVIEP
jgi:murein L,D-transpeptidase YafK